ncbi:peroxide stress protein YaaA [Clostridium saccharobutylicum]|uniref:peroxide stress protein YaaA n=1 Tax=Clostridium saccharobutylicum TaxID=169679 RepID=UPI0021504FC4|nr:peroxide stress protein YaaA [Clostridium saccharobutylicum]
MSLSKFSSFISCTFAEYKEDKIITKGTFAKMARGEMIRYMTEETIENISAIKNFNRLGYKYSEEKSNDKNIVFIR